MIASRNVIAKNKIHKIKLQSIATELERLDDKFHSNGLSKSEDILYDELVKSYKGLAMAWIKFRKANNLDADMIAANWS